MKVFDKVGKWQSAKIFYHSCRDAKDVDAFVSKSQKTVCPYTMNGVEGAGNWWAVLNQGRLNSGDSCGNMDTARALEMIRPPARLEESW